MINSLARELHVWRLMHLSRNPLVRKVDRWECTLSIVIMVCAITLLPFSFAVGDMAHSSAAAATQRERDERERVVATVTETPGAGAKSVSATWQAADGHGVVGDIESYSSDSIGSHRAIWIDAKGRVSERPQPMSASWVQGILAGVVTAAAIIAGAAGSIYGLRRAFDRGRYRSWTTEWRLARLDATN